MPVAAIAPILSAVAGPVLGALGGSQDPRGSTGQFNEKQIIDMLTQATSSQSGQSTYQNFNQAIEDPRFSSFRNSLLPLFGQEFNKAQQPIYGDGQKASTLQDINEQFAGIVDIIAQQGAARGQLGSGLMPQLNLEAQLAGAGQRANFLSQLPMLEENARRTSIGNLLNMGTNFAGRAPISQASSGTQESSQQGQSSQTQQGTTERSGTQSQQIEQPPLWQRLLSAGGGILGNSGGLSPFLQELGTNDWTQKLNNLPNNPNPAYNFSIMAPALSFGGAGGRTTNYGWKV